MKQKYIYLFFALVLAFSLMFSSGFIAIIILGVQAIFIWLYLVEVSRETALKMEAKRENKLEDMTPEQRKKFVEENFR